YTSLVDNQVFEFGDAGWVIQGARGTHNVLWLVLIGVPEVHFGQPVGFVGDFVGKTEVVEGLDRAGLNTIGLTQYQAAFATFNEASVYIRVGRQGSCRGHAGWTGANDHDVHGVWKLIRASHTDPRCGFDTVLG